MSARYTIFKRPDKMYAVYNNTIFTGALFHSFKAATMHIKDLQASKMISLPKQGIKA